MSTITLSRRYVTVKRKATEEPSIGLKRCKFVGSCDTRSDEHVVALVKTISPALETQAIEITDYEQFVLKEKRASFPKIKEGSLSRRNLRVLCQMSLWRFIIAKTSVI